MKEKQEDNNRGKDVVAVEKKPKGGLKQKKKKTLKKKDLTWLTWRYGIQLGGAQASVEKVE